MHNLPGFCTTKPLGKTSVAPAFPVESAKAVACAEGPLTPPWARNNHPVRERLATCGEPSAYQSKLVTTSTLPVGRVNGVTGPPAFTTERSKVNWPAILLGHAALSWLSAWSVTVSLATLGHNVVLAW